MLFEAILRCTRVVAPAHKPIFASVAHKCPPGQSGRRAAYTLRRAKAEADRANDSLSTDVYKQGPVRLSHIHTCCQPRRSARRSVQAGRCPHWAFKHYGVEQCCQLRTKAQCVLQLIGAEGILSHPDKQNSVSTQLSVVLTFFLAPCNWLPSTRGGRLPRLYQTSAQQGSYLCLA